MKYKAPASNQYYDSTTIGDKNNETTIVELMSSNPANFTVRSRARIDGRGTLEDGMHIGGNITVRLDSLNGTVVGQTSISVSESEHLSGYKIVTIPLIKSRGIHDLYFTFSNVEYPEEDIGFFDFMRFNIDKPNLP